MTRAMIFVGNSAFQEILKNIFRSRFPSIELWETVNEEKAMEKIRFSHDLRLAVLIESLSIFWQKGFAHRLYPEARRS